MSISLTKLIQNILRHRAIFVDLLVTLSKYFYGLLTNLDIRK